MTRAQEGTELGVQEQMKASMHGPQTLIFRPFHTLLPSKAKGSGEQLLSYSWGLCH